MENLKRGYQTWGGEGTPKHLGYLGRGYYHNLPKIMQNMTEGEWFQRDDETQPFIDFYDEYEEKVGGNRPYFRNRWPWGDWDQVSHPDAIYGGSDYDQILKGYETQKFIYGLGDEFDNPFQDVLTDFGAWEENAAGRRGDLNTLISDYEDSRSALSVEASDFGSALRRSKSEFATKGFAGSEQYEQNIGVGTQDYAARMDPLRSTSAETFKGIGEGLRAWHEEDYGLEGEVTPFYDLAEEEYESWLTGLEDMG